MSDFTQLLQQFVQESDIEQPLNDSDDEHRNAEHLYKYMKGQYDSDEDFREGILPSHQIKEKKQFDKKNQRGNKNRSSIKKQGKAPILKQRQMPRQKSNKVPMMKINIQQQDNSSTKNQELNEEDDPQNNNQKKIQIASAIEYGVLFNNKYYKSESVIAKHRPNFHFLEIQQRDQQYKIKISQQQQQIHIEVKQVRKIYTNPTLKRIIICCKSPPKFCINKFKKRYRLQNHAYKNVYQENPDQLLHSYFFIYKGFLAINFKNYTKGLKILKQQLKDIEIEQISQSFLPYKELITQYSRSKFEDKFKIQKISNKQKLYIHDLKFTLLSYLYCCEYFGPQELLELSQFITNQISVKKQQIEIVWRAIRGIIPDFIDICLQKQNNMDEVKALLTEKIFQKYKTKDQQEKIDQKNIIIPSYRITPSGLLPFGWNLCPRNKLTRHYRKYDFQFLTFSITNDTRVKDTNYYRYDEKYLNRIAQSMKEIHFLQATYIPLAWTQSQLKKNQMWYIQTKTQIKSIIRSQFLAFLGEFSQISNPALRGARIGQNLSTPFEFIQINNKVKVLIQEDLVSKQKMLYTDGIGRISANLAEKISKKLTGQATNAFQIRFHGSKGMLCMNRRLPDNTIILRNSMKKFECQSKQAIKYLDILQYNRYIKGYLNRQIIMLLQTVEVNNIPIENILEILDQYLNKIVEYEETIQDENYGIFRPIDNPEDQFEGLLKIQKLSEVVGLIKNKSSLDYSKQPTLRAVISEKYIEMLKDLLQRSRIKVDKSARLLGIIDQYGILRENQIYCTIIKSEKKHLVVKENIKGRVMITRNPCRHPADIRIVECVSEKQISERFQQKYKSANWFEDFPNTVIFPTDGKIPLTAQISGSDLDGDIFFITWDQRLIPKEFQPPYIVDQTKKKQRLWSSKDYEGMLNFFTQFFNNDNMGRIANNHLAKVDQQGALSKDCLDLCSAFYKAVDYPKKGYIVDFNKDLQANEFPHFMEKPDKKTYISNSALGIIHDISKRSYKSFIETKAEITVTKFIKGFDARLSFYSKQQIKYAINSILGFNTEIQHVIDYYKRQTEQQIYTLSSDQQQRNSYRYLSNLQVKYLKIFFESLQVDRSPIKYYMTLRNNYGYSFQQGSNPILLECVQRRILLWYHIIYYNTLEDCPERRRWFTQLDPYQKQMKIQLSKSIKHIGLLWFAVPCIFYIFLKQNKINFHKEKSQQQMLKEQHKQQQQQQKQQILLDIPKKTQKTQKTQKQFKLQIMKRIQDRNIYMQTQHIKQRDKLLNSKKQTKRIQQQKKANILNKRYQICDQQTLQEYILENNTFQKKNIWFPPNIQIKDIYTKDEEQQYIIHMKQLVKYQSVQNINLQIQQRQADQRCRGIQVEFQDHYMRIKDRYELSKLKIIYSLLRGNRIGILCNSPKIDIKNVDAELCVISFDQQKSEIQLFGVHYDDIQDYKYYFDLQQILTSQRQFKALQSIEQSPLYHIILNPSTMQQHQNPINQAKIQILKKSDIFKKIKQQRNQSQVRAIQNIASRNQGIYLIHGPPGTGKSSTILSMIAIQHQIIKNTKSNKKFIHVASQSNAAINDICRSILEKGLAGYKTEQVKLLRIGRVNLSSKDLMKYNYRYLYQRQILKKFDKLTTVQYQLQIQELQIQQKHLRMQSQEYDDIQFQIMELLQQIIELHKFFKQNKKTIEFQQKKLFRQNWLILTTLSGSGSKSILNNITNQVSCLIIDEASQATQPNILVPFQSNVKKITLVGDPQQLPPTIKSSNAQETKYNRSLFERCLHLNMKSYLLDTQYRMRPQLSAFPNRKFYGGRLKDHYKYESIPESLKNLVVDKCLYFFDLEYSKQERQIKSYKNQSEAEIVTQIAKILIKKDRKLSIGIITPYSGQTILINRLLKQSKIINSEEIKVSTVDAFQGQQRDVIIMTCMRSNLEKKIGFVKNQKRINVSLTRAKHLLIVVGNSNTLNNENIWKQYIKQHKNNETFYSFKSKTEAFTKIRKKILKKVQDKKENE